MPPTLTLPRLDGTLAPYTLSGRLPITAPPGPIQSRIGMAAVHVVADPLARINPTLEVALDWEATLRFRHHVWSLGLAVAEAMDTSQRGMGFEWPWIEGCGGRIILMASRALAACAKSPDDYVKVYGRILSQVREPVIIHWLGEMFDPALAGYWGSHDRDRQTETLLAIVTEYAAKIDGVKISLLDQAREIAMRRRFPPSVRMYTGDDFDYPTTIRGDGQRHSDALLGIFDVIAPAAAAALKALDRGDLATYVRVLAPTLTLSRHVFGDPTRFYKTGVVFAAYLNGHQSHFRMVGGMESARSVVHLSEQFRLMDAAGLLTDPDRAAERMRRVLAVAGVA